jgi:hypothetical protein
MALQPYNEMNDNTTANQPREEPEKFYLPAVTVPPKLDRIEAFVDDCFDFHGVVPIPTSYNK